jgi:hypothetical protein
VPHGSRTNHRFGPPACGDDARIGIETGAMTPWLVHELRNLGLEVVCLDARHARAALKMQINKTDQNDAEGLAQIVRTGWYRSVHVKSFESHRARALLGARAVARDSLILSLREGADYGWPQCHNDGQSQKLVLAPVGGKKVCLRCRRPRQSRQRSPNAAADDRRHHMRLTSPVAMPPSA